MSHWIGYPASVGGPFSATGNFAHYAVTEFGRTYRFDTAVTHVTVQACGDTVFQLFLNGDCVMTGPPSVGGDFIGNDTPRDNFYTFSTAAAPHTKELCFFARVQTTPVQLCDFSKGQGGFMLTATATTADGNTHTLTTGEDWQMRKNAAYTAPCRFDGTQMSAPFSPAVAIEDIWHAAPAPIPVREEYAYPLKSATVTVAAGARITRTWELDRIFGGFLAVETTGNGVVQSTFAFSETGEEGSREELTLCGDLHYRGFTLHSAGQITAAFQNDTDAPLTLTVSFIVTHYPVTDEARTVCSDEEWNAVLDTCRHTLKICRQTHHLDSTRHCEPLACTGDYYIESQMTPFAFGDMRLAQFDILRTAALLERENGRMYHTTYSLIWVRWLWDTYMLTGDVTLPSRCKRALDLLLQRFQTYLNTEHLLDTPPDFMFVDWRFIDGYSLHHPPKALGQSVLNMFYFGALDAAARIYETLGDTVAHTRCVTARESLRRAINTLLFDPARGLYHEGLNTPTPAALLREEMPPNTDKRYFLPYANILAALFGVCDDDTARGVIHRLFREDLTECQPYFLHFLLEAVFRLGLREQYTRPLLERWKAPVAACRKGLVEGFLSPEEHYVFDHSHAWGGTPLYALPKALLGLHVEEAGMQTLSLSPSLLGLSSATVEMFTPYGKLICEMHEGQPPRLSCPPEITIR